MKANNAQAAGYAAAIIFNEGQEGRTDVPNGTLGAPLTIPVVGVDFETGASLAEAFRPRVDTSRPVERAPSSPVSVFPSPESLEVFYVSTPKRCNPAISSSRDTD